MGCTIAYMARQPVRNERSVRKQIRTRAAELQLLGPGSKARKEERIYIKDLAKHLMCQSGRLKRKASGWGLLFRGRVGTMEYADWVTPRTAMRLIAVVRAEQAEKMLKGRDPIALALAERARKLRRATGRY